MSDQMEIDEQPELLQEEEQIDELQLKFQEIEESEDLNKEKAAQQYDELLANSRDDEIANKIKEKCVYK